MSISAMTKALEALESIKVTVSTSTEANVIDGIDLFPKQIAELRIGIAEAEQRSRMRNTTLVHANDISQECVDETAKHKHDLVYRLRKRAEIRRQIPDRKSVQEGQPDRIADLLEEAADALEKRGWTEQPDLARVGEVGVWGDKRVWVGLDDDIPGLGLVTEEFYNGMLCAEDILRKRNT
jgi:hypothetical protein